MTINAAIKTACCVTGTSFADAKYAAESLIARAKGVCAAKAAYDSRNEVTTYLRQSGFPGKPYRCPFCSLWHATTMPRQQQKTLMRQIRAASKLLNPPIQ